MKEPDNEGNIEQRRSYWALARPLVIEILAVDPYTNSPSVASRRSTVARWVYELARDDIALLTPELALNEFELQRLLPTYVKDWTHKDKRTTLRSMRVGFPSLFDVPPRVVVSPESLPPVQPEQVKFALTACVGLRQPTETKCEGLIRLCVGAGMDGADLRHVTGDHVVERASGVWVVVEWGDHPREVPVMRAHARPLLTLAQTRRGRLLVTDAADPCPTGAVGRISRKIDRRIEMAGGDFKVSPTRLRKAWLVELIGRHPPLDLLKEVAGLDSLRAIDQLMVEHMAPSVASEKDIRRLFG